MVKIIKVPEGFELITYIFVFNAQTNCPNKQASTEEIYYTYSLISTLIIIAFLSNLPYNAIKSIMVSQNQRAHYHA